MFDGVGLWFVGGTGLGHVVRCIVRHDMHVVRCTVRHACCAMFLRHGLANRQAGHVVGSWRSAKMWVMTCRAVFVRCRVVRHCMTCSCEVLAKRQAVVHGLLTCRELPCGSRPVAKPRRLVSMGDDVRSPTLSPSPPRRAQPTPPWRRTPPPPPRPQPKACHVC